MLDIANMPSQPVQVSIEKSLLKRIDTDPETKKLGRSAFIRSAVELYLRAKERRAVDESIRRAYSGKRDELLTEIEDLIEVQQWPET
jgi:metal-responsive CopG/Arc/MetJ family transcriptional regulator